MAASDVLSVKTIFLALIVIVFLATTIAARRRHGNWGSTPNPDDTVVAIGASVLAFFLDAFSLFSSRRDRRAARSLPGGYDWQGMNPSVPSAAEPSVAWQPGVYVDVTSLRTTGAVGFVGWVNVAAPSAAVELALQPLLGLAAQLTRPAPGCVHAVFAAADTRLDAAGAQLRLRVDEAQPGVATVWFAVSCVQSAPSQSSWLAALSSDQRLAPAAAMYQRLHPDEAVYASAVTVWSAVAGALGFGPQAVAALDGRVLHETIVSTLSK